MSEPAARLDDRSRYAVCSGAMADDLLERAHDDFSWAGSSDDGQHDLAIRALEAHPDDPVVLYRCLQLWHYFAMPVDQSYSSCGPTRADGRKLLDRALAAGQRVLDAHAERDSVPLHALFFWVNEIRALDRMRERPSPGELAKACAELDAVLPELTHLKNEPKRWSFLFRCQTLARRRSWELLASAPAYPNELRDTLAMYISVFDNCMEWPIAPVARDPALQARISADLAERAVAKTHPRPRRQGSGTTATVSLKERVLGAPDEGELLGRLRVLLWLGVDESMFTSLATQAIEDRAPRAVLEVLLVLGFDPNAPIARLDTPSPDGHTLLHEAVRADHAEAVAMLVAAGADPKRVNKPERGNKTKRQSALDLARSRKKPAILAALEGKTAAPSAAAAELATKLRESAKAMDPKELERIASTFGVAAPDPRKAVETVLARSPETAAQILDDLGGTFVFERYLVARALRAAGYVVDRKLRGPLILDGNLTVSGDLVVDGTLVDDLGASTIVVAGDVRVTSLVTESDVIIGGSLHATELVWGDYNDGSLVVEGAVTSPLLLMTDHTFDHEGPREVGIELIDPEGDELATHFVGSLICDGSLDRERVVKAVTRGAPILKRATKAKRRR